MKLKADMRPGLVEEYELLQAELYGGSPDRSREAWLRSRIREIQHAVKALTPSSRPDCLGNEFKLDSK